MQNVLLLQVGGVGDKNLAISSLLNYSSCLMDPLFSLVDFCFVCSMGFSFPLVRTNSFPPVTFRSSIYPP